MAEAMKVLRPMVASGAGSISSGAEVFRTLALLEAVSIVSERWDALWNGSPPNTPSFNVADVTIGQIVLLCLAAALFAAGWAASLLRMWWEGIKPLRLISKASVYFALLAGMGVLVWHSVARRSLAAAGGQLRRARLARAAAGAVRPVRPAGPPAPGAGLVPRAGHRDVALISAAVFGKAKPHEYNVRNVWAWVHRVTAYGGAVAFAVAGAVGCMYLIVNRRLRAKPPLPGPNLGSLERLEHLTLVSVTLGFAC